MDEEVYKYKLIKTKIIQPMDELMVLMVKISKFKDEWWRITISSRFHKDELKF